MTQIQYQRSIIAEEAAECMACRKQGKCNGICDEVDAEALGDNDFFVEESDYDPNDN
jgi:hypothetical protein